MAANASDVRIARLEGAYEQADRRLAVIEVDMRDLRAEVRNLQTTLIGRMDRQFFWTLGLLIVSILVPLALRVLRA